MHRQPGVLAVRPVFYEQVRPRAEPLTLNPSPETQNPKPETRNPNPETRNTKPKTRNLNPEPRNPNPETRNPKPETHNPKPETRDPKPETRNPKPKTRDPKPEALNPKPKTRKQGSWLFRGGLIFMAHRLVYHSTLGLRVIKKKKKFWLFTTNAAGFCASALSRLQGCLAHKKKKKKLGPYRRPMPRVLWWS